MHRSPWIRMLVAGAALLTITIVVTIAGATAGARAAEAADAPPSTTVVAPTGPATVRVVTKPLEPFVIRTDRGEIGFSIDLWNEIARRNGWSTEWVANETVGQLLDTVRAGGADVGIAGISMTREREDQLDFSYPMFDAGLQVMIDGDSSSGVSRLFSAVFTRDLGFFTLGLLVVLVVAGHFVWLYQRRHGDVDHGYARGVGQGVWIATATALAGDLGEGAPNRILGRIFAILWLLVGVVLVAMLTASVTSRLTVDSIDSDINGLGDLVDKQVVTVERTTASRYLDAVDQPYRTVATIDEAYGLLRSGSVDAIVFDAPVLAYHAVSKGRGREQLVGPVFNRESYGIAMPTGSTRREAVNRTLLELEADGTYARITQQWFGREGG